MTTTGESTPYVAAAFVDRATAALREWETVKAAMKEERDD